MTRDIWILAEQRHGAIASVSFELLARAAGLARPHGAAVGAVLLSPPLSDEALQPLIARGADYVIALESPRFATFAADRFSAALCREVRARRPAVLLGAADSTGRTLLPYAAMTLHTGLTADCTGLAIDASSGLLLQTRPAIGGNIMATITCAERRPQMATVRPHACRPLPADPARAGRILRVPVPAGECAGDAVTVERVVPDAETLPLQDAEKIVVAGRGIRRPETLGLVRAFAGLIGAAVGASREVVDRGWLSYPHQIGLSGKTVTPRLYIGLGVSGAIQHLAGMQTAETIVAINKDPEAPIFAVADFGIVGDLADVLPALIADLQKGARP